MNLEEQLKPLPNHPGVYLMRNAAGQVIYVGKAISLRSRVRSYFQSSRGHTPKTVTMVSQVASIDYILVDSEVEALILENNLIKEHSPRYNIRLRDDKTYPYVKVTANEEYPRVFATRKVARDGAHYYGPYTDVDGMHEVVRLLKSIYPIRDCRKPLKPDPEARPCLNYHIKRCAGPCICAVSKDQYCAMVHKIEQFLDGKEDSVVRDLRSQMSVAAEELQFESAAEFRDKIAAVQKVVERQKIVSIGDDDQDVVAIAKNDKLACAQVLLVRDGKMVGREHYYLEVTEEHTDEEVLAAFLARYYDDAPHVPKEVIVEVDLPEQAVVETWLSEKRGRKVDLHAPKRGDKVRLVEMGHRNAAMLLEQAEMKRGLEESRADAAMQVIADYLDLPELPHRMECYDISNISGTQTVASMVVFEGGRPKKSDYRHFKIRTVEGSNDFASMAEVIGRRFQRAPRPDDAVGPDAATEAAAESVGAGPSEAEGVAALGDIADPSGTTLPVSPQTPDPSFSSVPDLVIIDGGKGQLSAAREVMETLGFGYVPTVGLAKEFEHLFRPGDPNPIILPRGSEALYMVQRIRDEAHRFAITFHRSLRGKAQVKSVLDEILGIGKKRRLALLLAFGSVERIRAATPEELAAVAGMNRDVAQKVHDHLKQAPRANPSDD